MEPIQIIFEGNSNLPYYKEAVKAFKKAVSELGGIVCDYGMGIPGVDPTMTVKGLAGQQLHDSLLPMGYDFGFVGADDFGHESSIKVTPPSRLSSPVSVPAMSLKFAA